MGSKGYLKVTGKTQASVPLMLLLAFICHTKKRTVHQGETQGDFNISLNTTGSHLVLMLGFIFVFLKLE